MGAEKAQIAIAWAEHEGPCVARKNRYDIIHCEMCGFRHAVPLPKPADLEREYREAYYADEKPTYLSHAGEDQQWAELWQIDRLERFERILGASRRPLLELGSGPGLSR